MNKKCKVLKEIHFDEYEWSEIKLRFYSNQIKEISTESSNIFKYCWFKDFGTRYQILFYLWKSFSRKLSMLEAELIIPHVLHEYMIYYLLLLKLKLLAEFSSSFFVELFNVGSKTTKVHIIYIWNY